MEQLITTLALLDWHILAQAQIDTFTDKSLSTLTKFSLVICVAGLILAGFNLIRGQVEFAVYAALGSLIIGASAVFAKAIFALFESL